MKQYNFEIVRGDDLELEITVTNDGEPVDITDATVFFTMKSNTLNADDSATTLQEVVTDHLLPEEGLTKIEVSHEKFTEKGIVASRYNYDVQVVDATGKIRTIMMGIITVLQDVTLSEGS